jgi:hypothetical protein
MAQQFEALFGSKKNYFFISNIYFATPCSLPLGVAASTPLLCPGQRQSSAPVISLKFS